MGQIPSHLQHWDDWRSGGARRRGHTALWIAFGVAVELAAFWIAVIGVLGR